MESPSRQRSKKTLETLNEEVENVSEELHQLASEDENPFSWKAIQAANKKIDDGEIENAGIANASLTEITNGLEEVPSLTLRRSFFRSPGKWRAH